MKAFGYPSKVIAHRGGGSVAPENTLAGLAEASARGFVAVEFDVMLAQVDVPVLMHDDTLERTTNGRGAVPEHSASELARLDAGTWRGAKFAGEPVPDFEAAAACCRKLGLFANVEIKPYAPGGELVAIRTAEVVAEVCARVWRDAPDRLLVSSFAPAALEAAGRVAPGLARACLFDAVPPDWADRMRRLACVALHCNWKNLDQPTARAVKDAGFGLMCWTVNDVENAKHLFEWGVDAVCTDRLDLFGAMVE